MIDVGTDSCGARLDVYDKMLVGGNVYITNSQWMGSGARDLCVSISATTKGPVRVEHDVPVPGAFG